jgi:hypothetical protein
MPPMTADPCRETFIPRDYDPLAMASKFVAPGALSGLFCFYHRWNGEIPYFHDAGDDFDTQEKHRKKPSVCWAFSLPNSTRRESFQLFPNHITILATF